MSAVFNIYEQFQEFFTSEIKTIERRIIRVTNIFVALLSVLNGLYMLMNFMEIEREKRGTFLDKTFKQ